jgi:hypothetical protein
MLPLIELKTHLLIFKAINRAQNSKAHNLQLQEPKTVTVNPRIKNQDRIGWFFVHEDDSKGPQDFLVCPTQCPPPKQKTIWRGGGISQKMVNCEI